MLVKKKKERHFSQRNENKKIKPKPVKRYEKYQCKKVK